jgi:hypothetical protein
VTETPHHRSRFLGLLRILRWLVAFEVLASVGLVVVLVTRPHITIFVALASVAATLVLVLLALALRMVFRDLPELERMSTKFDEAAAAQKDRQVRHPR